MFREFPKEQKQMLLWRSEGEAVCVWNLNVLNLDQFVSQFDTVAKVLV